MPDHTGLIYWPLNTRPTARGAIGVFMPAAGPPVIGVESHPPRADLHICVFSGETICVVNHLGDTLFDGPAKYGGWQPLWMHIGSTAPRLDFVFHDDAGNQVPGLLACPELGSDIPLTRDRIYECLCIEEARFMDLQMWGPH